MDKMPEIGTRVLFTPPEKSCQHMTCTGVVVAQYPGCHIHNIPDSVCVKVDELPEWWDYPDDRFPPDISTLQEAN